jgi:hypothetical protein
MYIIAIAWLYVALMAAIVEALAPNGTLLGAFFTLLLYGVLPLTIVLYVFGSPARRRARQRAERAAAESAAQPDGSGHAAGDAVAPIRKEP